MKTFNIGDKVMYAAAFLRSVGIYTGRIPFAWGVVIGLSKLGDSQLVEIDWNDEDIPARVLASNLVKKGAIEND